MKKLFRSFRFKLIISLFLIVFVILGSLYFVVNRTTQEEFRDYVIRGRSNQLRGLREGLLEFYRENETWRGVDSYFRENVTAQAGGNGRGMGSGGNKISGGERSVALIGVDGRIIFSYDDDLVSKKVPEDLIGQGVVLEEDGRRIGTLLAGPLLSAELEGSERRFLASIDRTIIYAGAVGLAFALLLGWALFQQLTRPLNELTRATKKISSGDLDHRVSIDSEDEFGDLASSFNAMTKNLQESEEIRRRMIGDIAHELRTPLTVLSGEVEAIREGVYEPTDEKLKEIQDDLNLLHRLIEDLRELTLAEAGELELNRGPTDLLRLVKSVTRKLENIAELDGVVLETDLPASIPELNLDSERISQVLNNLVRNAIQHTARGDKVIIRVEEREDRVLVEVIDTGEGIPKEKLEHVFDRFYRGDSSRSSGGGSGLGLSIAKELAEAHGGDIKIDSEPGEGTMVTFSLPK